MTSLTTSDDDMLVPAQLTLTGYQPRRADGEKRHQAAVSTGTAAHTDPGKALLNAIQELVQLDSVIRHWHSDTPSVRIICDRRTRTLQRLIDTYWDTHAPYPEFHLLASPDLPGFTIACLIRGHEGHHPAIAVGLGADTKLTLAMYKALLEATTLANSLSWKPLTDHKREEPAFYDLDSNVNHYADPTNAHIVEDKFARCTAINAADLEPDFTGDTRSTVRHFINAFRTTGKQLLYASLSTPDIHQLSFHVSRVWSPDTLSLTLPSAPAKQHRRFHNYGGYQNDHPHPYP
jgi:ribosomal protein S12 methylthiotransferase accessory factor